MNVNNDDFNASDTKINRFGNDAIYGIREILQKDLTNLHIFTINCNIIIWS